MSDWEEGGVDDVWPPDDDPAGHDPGGSAEYEPAGYDPAGYDPAGYDPAEYDLAYDASGGQEQYGAGPGDSERHMGSDGGRRRPRRSRVARVVVLVVLAGVLAGGIVLGRGSGAPAVRVATPGLDGPQVPPADAVSTAWYCAAGTSAGGSGDETVFVANLSPVVITADVTVDPGGDDDPATTRLRVGPYARASLAVSDVLSADSPGVIVEIAGGAAIVEHEIRAGGDIAMSPCSHAPASRWYFASGGTSRGATQTLELFNPFGDDAIVDVAFLTEGGVQEPQALQGLVVGRRSKVRVPVNDLVARQERVATLVRTRTGRVVAEQVRAFDGTDGRTGLTLSLGVTAPRRQWTLPVAQADTGAVGAVAVANFGLTPASVEVSILLSGDGVLVPETLDVPARSVVRFDPSGRIPVGSTYSLVVQAQGSEPVVAETLLTATTGAATTAGSSVAARRWALAGAPPGASSAVVVVNRGAAPVTVELRAYTAGDVDSPRSAPALAIPPGKSARFDLDEWSIDPDQVLVIAANGPIVAGRETYVGGVSLALAVPFPD